MQSGRRLLAAIAAIVAMALTANATENPSIEQRLAALELKASSTLDAQSALSRQINSIKTDTASYQARIQAIEEKQRITDTDRIKEMAENTEKVAKDLTSAWLSKSQEMQTIVDKLRNSVDYKLEERLQKVVDDVSDLGTRMTETRTHGAALETRLDKTTGDVTLLQKKQDVDHQGSVDEIKKLQNRVDPLEDHKTWAVLHIQTLERQTSGLDTKTTELVNNFDRVRRLADNIAQDLDKQKQKQENDRAAGARDLTHAQDKMGTIRDDLTTTIRQLQDQVTSMDNVLSKRTLANSAAVGKVQTKIQSNFEEAEREIGKAKAAMRRLLVESEHWRSRTQQLLVARIKPLHNQIEQIIAQKQIDPEKFKESMDEFVASGQMPQRDDLFKVIATQKKNGQALDNLNTKLQRTAERLTTQMNRLLDENKVLKLIVPLVKDSLPEDVRQQMDDLLVTQQKEQDLNTKTPDVRVVFIPKGTEIPQKLKDELAGENKGCCGQPNCSDACNDEGPPKKLEIVEAAKPKVSGKVDCRLYPC